MPLKNSRLTSINNVDNTEDIPAQKHFKECCALMFRIATYLPMKDFIAFSRTSRWVFDLQGIDIHKMAEFAALFSADRQRFSRYFPTHIPYCYLKKPLYSSYDSLCSGTIRPFYRLSTPFWNLCDPRKGSIKDLLVHLPLQYLSLEEDLISQDTATREFKRDCALDFFIFSCPSWFASLLVLWFISSIDSYIYSPIYLFANDFSVDTHILICQLIAISNLALLAVSISGILLAMKLFLWNVGPNITLSNPMTAESCHQFFRESPSFQFFRETPDFQNKMKRRNDQLLVTDSETDVPTVYVGANRYSS